MTVSSVNCRFPKDVAVRQQWVLEIRRKNFTPSGTSVICSDYFEESCYVGPTELSRKLQTGTVPTIFKLPEHLIKVPNERKHPKQINAIDTNGSQLSINNDPSTSYSCLSPSKETSQRLQDEHAYIATWIVLCNRNDDWMIPWPLLPRHLLASLPAKKPVSVYKMSIHIATWIVLCNRNDDWMIPWPLLPRYLLASLPAKKPVSVYKMNIHIATWLVL